MAKGAFVPRKGVRDLCAHQNNLRGIIDPYQEDVIEAAAPYVDSSPCLPM
jgi:hypothetical protein